MLGKTPPMGWNSWNTFGPNISETLIMEIADAMVEKGYKDAGYEYVVIDDGWQLRERGENGISKGNKIRGRFCTRKRIEVRDIFCRRCTNLRRVSGFIRS